MTFLACSSIGNWPIIKQVAYLFGFVMRGIFLVLDAVGIHNIAACIILFTIITRMILLPMTFRQQKFSKLSAAMNPELQALQKKYANKKDNASMQKMQMEQQQIYDKYGTSMTAGCLPSLIQIILLFALYPVVYNLEKYVPELANFTEAEITQMYTFCGIYLNDTPKLGLNPSVLIPILAGVFQFISTRLTMMNQPSMNDNNGMASSMKTMNYMMPIMSVVFCFSFSAFIGVYWIAMSLVMVVQQWFINRHMKNVSVDDMIRENIEKQNKKRAKKGLPPINEKATMSTKNISKSTAKPVQRQSEVDKGAYDAKVKASTDYYKEHAAKPGSLAAKANMVQEYNKKHNKK